MVFDGSHAPQMNFHLDLGTKFLAGALIYQWRVPLRGKAALVCLAVLMGCVLFGQLAMAQRTVLAYLVMYLALAAPFNLPSPAARFGDLSYGTYIYAWPVKQLVVLCSHQPHWFVTAAVSTPIVLVLAWLSWHFVEKGALALKDRPFPGIAAKSRSTEPPLATRRVLRTHQ
jgi:peptidoglycan/LPS O-acetylase OafA/YrhL